MTQLPNTNVYLIEVPKDAYDFSINGISVSYKILAPTYAYPAYRVKSLPECYWQLLGLITPDSIGFDCTPYLDRKFNGLINVYRDYRDKECKQGFVTAYQSFMSLLKSVSISFEKSNWVAVDKR